MEESAYDLTIAEVLAARLCHELVSPIGAIANGVEIIEDEPEFAEDAGHLIAQSAREAGRRLNFYRIAYGSTGPIPTERARAATLELFVDGKILCDWPETLPPLPEGGEKIACNLLLTAAEALPRGGRVRLISGFEAGVAILAVVATGDVVRLTDPVPALLAGVRRVEDVAARTVQAAFTAALVRRQGRRITLRQEQPGEIFLTVSTLS